MKIALVQISIGDDIRENLNRAEDLCSTAAEDGAEVVVLPELFSTGFPPDRAVAAAPVWGPETRKCLAELAVKHGISLVAGCGDETDGGKMYNTGRVYTPDGKCVSEYRKIHLFTFGHEEKYVIPGSEPVLFHLLGYPASLFVCYDLRFPLEFRQVAPHVTLIIVLANWPEERREHWMCLLKARAIENQCWIIGVNRIGKDSSGLRYSGDSMVVDPLGNVIEHMDDQEGVKLVDIDPEKCFIVRKLYPFLSDQ
jgi:predicted amidohydrolase